MCPGVPGIFSALAVGAPCPREPCQSPANLDQKQGAEPQKQGQTLALEGMQERHKAVTPKERLRQKALL